MAQEALEHLGVEVGAAQEVSAQAPVCPLRRAPTTPLPWVVEVEVVLPGAMQEQKALTRYSAQLRVPAADEAQALTSIPAGQVVLEVVPTDIQMVLTAGAQEILLARHHRKATMAGPDHQTMSTGQLLVAVAALVLSEGMEHLQVR